MIAVENKKEVHRDFKRAQSSLAWGHHPLQCKEHACGKQQGAVYFLFCFPTKKPNTELAQFGC